MLTLFAHPRQAMATEPLTLRPRQLAPAATGSALTPLRVTLANGCFTVAPGRSVVATECLARGRPTPCTRDGTRCSGDRTLGARDRTLRAGTRTLYAEERATACS